MGNIVKKMEKLLIRSVFIIVFLGIFMSCEKKKVELFSYDLYEDKTYKRKINLTANDVLSLEINGNIDFFDSQFCDISLTIVGSDGIKINSDTIALFPLRNYDYLNTSVYGEHYKAEFSGTLENEIKISKNDQYTLYFEIINSANIYKINKAKISVFAR